ncbi:MAG TPA: molybdopterin molybdotransferase MoeA [Thermoleophilaceae bacterium]
MTAGLISVAEARERVLAAVRPLAAEAVPIGEALGRVLAEEVAAAEDLPPFDASAMDGYAVVAGEAAELDVVDESRAGAPAERTLGAGEAIRISTGARMPAGADAVVPVERVREPGGGGPGDGGPGDDRPGDGEPGGGEPGGGELGGGGGGPGGGRPPARVWVPEVEPGANVRLAGEDVRSGQVVLRPGAEVGPAEVAMLAWVGRTSVRCGRAPRVSIVVTGDELVEPGAPLGPGRIRDSNSPALAALATRAGATVAAARRAPDDYAATVEALRAAVAEADVVCVSGGVSVGPHDHVKPALRELGAEERFWGVALKPGKPTWFGTVARGMAGAEQAGGTAGRGTAARGEQAGGTARGEQANADRVLVFGLPGNPVSAMVTFHLLARPALRALTGADPSDTRVRARLDAPVRRSPRREQAVRCRVRATDDGWRLDPTGPQESHRISSMLGAGALAMIPAGEGALDAGDPVDAELLPRGTVSA